MLRRLLLLSLAAAFLATPAAAEGRFGIGVHYWTAVSDIDFDSIDEDGLAWVLSYQWAPESLLHFELDLEYFPDGFGGAQDSAYSPIAFAIVGRSLYGAVGIGVTFSSDFQDDISDPFYVARVGFDLTLLPGIAVDINANYRAGAFDELDQASSDAVTLGAILRFKL